MKKQKLILFILLIFFIIPFSSCKKTEEADVYNIVGRWGVVLQISGQTFTGTFTFSGNLTTGTFSDGASTGAYNVNGTQVIFSIDETDATYGRTHWAFTGAFTDTNHMNGTFTILYIDLNNQQASGTWTCNR